MKTRLAGFVVWLALLGVSQAAANTIYAVNDGYTFPPLRVYVNGTITTDSKTGVLGATDITAWSLTVTYPGLAPYTLTDGNSVVTVVGNALTATSTALLWDYDFTAHPNAYFEFAKNDGVVGDIAAFVTYVAGTPGVFSTDEYTICQPCSHDPATASGFGTEVIATVTPLPAALPLFATGLSALGLLGWRRKRKAAAVAA